MNAQTLDAVRMQLMPNRPFNAAPKPIVPAEGVAYRTADSRASHREAKP